MLRPKGNARYADRSPTRAAEGSRPVSLRNAGEDCRLRERHQPARRGGPEHSRARAFAAPAPSPIASVTVQATNGWFDISITDPSDARPGLFYFAESDTTPAFGAPRVYFMGASRNMYVQLGNQTLFWRAYSQYIGSLPSAPVTFGAPPIAVAGGGSSGPAPLPSSGSGVFPNGIPRGGNGFGIHPGSRVVRQTVL